MNRASPLRRLRSRLFRLEAMLAHVVDGGVVRAGALSADKIRTIAGELLEDAAE